MWKAEWHKLRKPRLKNISGIVLSKQISDWLQYSKTSSEPEGHNGDITCHSFLACRLQLGVHEGLRWVTTRLASHQIETSPDMSSLQDRSIRKPRRCIGDRPWYVPCQREIEAQLPRVCACYSWKSNVDNRSKKCKVPWMFACYSGPESGPLMSEIRRTSTTKHSTQHNQGSQLWPDTQARPHGRCIIRLQGTRRSRVKNLSRTLMTVCARIASQEVMENPQTIAGTSWGPWKKSTNQKAALNWPSLSERGRRYLKPWLDIVAPGLILFVSHHNAAVPSPPSRHEPFESSIRGILSRGRDGKGSVGSDVYIFPAVAPNSLLASPRFVWVNLLFLRYWRNGPRSQISLLRFYKTTRFKLRIHNLARCFLNPWSQASACW